jgi:hypothetical protein
MRLRYLIFSLCSGALLTACTQDAPPLTATRSTQDFFPVELGEITPRALGKVQCAGRKTQWDGEVLSSLECPEYTIGRAVREKGRLSISFSANRVNEVKWELNLLEAPLERVSRFHAELVQHFREPAVSNVETPETWKAALERGEWHHRWGLGNGLLFSWFARVDDYALGNSRTPGDPRYAWVLMAKYRPFD